MGSTKSKGEGTRQEANRSASPEKPVGRLGDLSVKLVHWVVANPALSIALATALLFVMARIPAEIFYGRFGLRPEDVGLNSVQVLLQGTTTVLVVSLAIAVIYGILLPIASYGYWVLMGWLFTNYVGKPDNRAQEAAHKVIRRFLPSSRSDHRASLHRIVRAAPLVITASTLVVAAGVLAASAVDEANAIEAGTAPQSKLGLFHVNHVEATWVASRKPGELSGCSDLYFLGEGGGRIALFDSTSDTTLRLNSDELRLAYPDDC